jgi:hypothetical protein
MEIRHIWISKYNGVLENLNVNLNHTGLHQFQYHDGRLEMVPNKASVLSFGENIKSVTAIAGKNGSGKSSICEIILHAAATHVNGAFGWELPFKGIICYSDRIYYEKTLPIHNVEELSQAGYTLIEFEESPFEKLPMEVKLEYHKGSFIYYSNVLDWRSDISLMNLVNISTQALVSTDYRTGTNRPPDLRDQSAIPDHLRTYHQVQAYRTVKYYLHFHDKIPFNHPLEIILKSTYSQTNRYIGYRELDEFGQFYALEQNIINSVFDEAGRGKPDPSAQVDAIVVKEAIMDLYRFNLLMTQAVSNQQLPDYAAAEAFIRAYSQDFSLFDKPEKAKELIRLHEKLVGAGEVTAKFSPDYLRYHFEHINWKFAILEHLYVKNTIENRELLKSFLNLEERLLRGNDRWFRRLSNFDLYPYPSTGEASYFTFFSRLYDTILRYDVGDEGREDLVLFIDEGETGYHPDWKRKFLSWIIEFLNADFNKYKFQLILTTHSPYLLSDLSSEHVLLLNRPQGGSTQIVSDREFQTFGANINELLADAFFLTDGLIGDFAKSQIQKVINQLNQWRLQKLNEISEKVFSVDNAQKDNCRKVISLIGDRIVRNKLFEMYWELFDDDTALDEEIFYLEERMKQLKSRKN